MSNTKINSDLEKPANPKPKGRSTPLVADPIVKTVTKTLVTKRQLATHLSIPIDVVNQHLRDGLPVAQVGERGLNSMYDVDEVLAWLQTHSQKNNAAMSAAKLRKAIADASLAELELEKERGSVVEIEEVATQVARVFAAIRSKLLSLPTKSSGLVLGLQSQKEVQTVLDTSIREVLDELSSYMFEAE